jgi:hypothetical protein
MSLRYASYRNRRLARKQPASPGKFAVENHGTIVLVRPLSRDGAQWLQNTAPKDAQFFGDALCVEPRYVNGVLGAIIEAGGEV